VRCSPNIRTSLTRTGTVLRAFPLATAMCVASASTGSGDDRHACVTFAAAMLLTNSGLVVEASRIRSPTELTSGVLLVDVYVQAADRQATYTFACQWAAGHMAVRPLVQRVEP
jgi:hypothetical protein